MDSALDPWPMQRVWGKSAGPNFGQQNPTGLPCKKRMQMDTHYGIYHIKRWNVNWILQEKWKVVKLYTDTDGQPIPKSLADWRFMC